MRGNRLLPLVLCLWGNGAFATPASQKLAAALRVHELGERDFMPRYAREAKGSWEGPHAEHAWPFPPLSIGHAGNSYQNYGGQPYFHHGIDIRGDAGTPVHTPVAGKVVNVENYVRGDDAYWEVALQDDDGYVWQYHHLERRSIPQAVWDAFKTGGRIAEGQLLGQIFRWQVDTFGERYHHVHLNILGQGGVYLNPLAFLTPLPDDQGPEIVAIGAYQNRRRVTSDQVSGAYQLYVEARDWHMHPRFILPPYEITYRLDGDEPVTVWRFDRLPGGASNTRHVEDFFVPGLSCGNYQCRRFVMDLGFNPAGPRTFPRTAGRHEIVVTVRDFSGHEASQSYQWTVR